MDPEMACKSESESYCKSESETACKKWPRSLHSTLLPSLFELVLKTVFTSLLVWRGFGHPIGVWQLFSAKDHPHLTIFHLCTL